MTQAPNADTQRAEPEAEGADDVDVPSAVARVYEDWDARGRPAQAATVWQRERWLAELPAEAQLLEALPDRLDRSIVRQLVLDKPGTERGMFEAMIIVYAWDGPARPSVRRVRGVPSGRAYRDWDQRCWPRVTR